MSKLSNPSEAGTQSPPLEATGSDKPMGVSSISGGKIEAVPDAKQREQYFQGEIPSKTKPETNAQPVKLGKKLFDDSASA